MRAAEHVLVCAGRVPDYDRTMRIRAAVLEEFGAPLAVQEVELEEPRAGEALVRLVACGVCHTDLYTASGADPSGYAPAVLGHEGAGVVEAFRNGMYKIALDNGHETLGYTAGKMRRYRIRINPGDRVKVEVSPYDLGRGRIVYRER